MFLPWTDDFSIRHRVRLEHSKQFLDFLITDFDVHQPFSLQSINNETLNRNLTILTHPYILKWSVTLNMQFYLSLVTRVGDLVRLKPTCTATEASWRLEILDIETRGIILSRQRTTKVLIRLRKCAGWSVPLLFAYGIYRFSHDMSHLYLA